MIYKKRTCSFSGIFLRHQFTDVKKKKISSAAVEENQVDIINIIIIIILN